MHVRWILSRNGLDYEQRPYVEGEQVVFDVNPREMGDHFSVRLELDNDPPGLHVALKASFSNQREELERREERS